MGEGDGGEGDAFPCFQQKTIKRRELGCSESFLIHTCNMWDN